jgi:cytochrome c oxidase subunit III
VAAEPAHRVPGLAHQFESLEQQKESAVLGMWLFLVTEILFFGGLFLAYTVYRWAFPESFVAASRTLDVTLGTINTAVLIGSSLTMALAVRAAQMGRNRLCAGYLAATIVLGAGFLGVKAVEYADKFEHHHVPGPSFRFEDEHGPAASHAGSGAHAAAASGTHARSTAASSARGAHAEPGGAAAPAPPASRAPHAQMFFNLYFAMTGLHAFHMVIGIGVILFVIVQALKGRYTPDNHNFVEGVGLYWHFVDLVWIFLFPLLYLIGRHH